nr:hypothetical protein GCM10020093_084560 [Planobispora longispora]
MPNVLDILAVVPPFAWWVTGGVVAAVLILTGLRRIIRYVTTRPLEDTLTIAAAAIATGVSAQGMWQFAGDVLGFDGPLRVLLFGFIEIAVVISAVRARRNVQESAKRSTSNILITPSAGVDGIAVWVLTCLTAVLSSLDASSPAEAVFRLAAPLVAAWLWERGMAIERTRITGLGGIHWRLTPERILVRLGLAEPTGRTASEVDVHRRLTRVAQATVRVMELTEADAWSWRVNRAQAAGRRALTQAEEHTDLATNPQTQTLLLNKITTLRGSAHLTSLPARPPWLDLDHPAVTLRPRYSDALELAAELRANTAARLRGTAADATTTSPEVVPEVASQVVPGVHPRSRWSPDRLTAGRQRNPDHNHRRNPDRNPPRGCG